MLNGQFAELIQGLCERERNEGKRGVSIDGIGMLSVRRKATLPAYIYLIQSKTENKRPIREASLGFIPVGDDVPSRLRF